MIPATADLFEQPIARPSDPGTSHKAAYEHTASGKRALECERWHQLIAENPGHTTAELWKFYDKKFGGEPWLTINGATKRISDLLNRNLIRVGTERACTVSKDVAWRLC